MYNVRHNDVSTKSDNVGLFGKAAHTEWIAEQRPCEARARCNWAKPAARTNSRHRQRLSELCGQERQMMGRRFSDSGTLGIVNQDFSVSTTAFSLQRSVLAAISDPSPR